MLLFLLGCPANEDSTPTDTSSTDTGIEVDTADTADSADSGDTADTAAGVPNEAGCEARHEPFIAALQTDLDASEALGVSAAVMEGGVVTCRVALGRRLVESEVAPDIETLFQIGSTTKMFTALALLQRVEAGDIALDQSLASAYPESEFDFDETWNDEVLLGHLITHQGGFYDYFDWSSSDEDSDLVDWHAEVFFPYLWLMNDPGHFWNYSNPNFNIAGLVVQAMDGGRAYPDIMVQDVFVPLGMTRTYQRKSEAEADGNYAEGFGYIMRGNREPDYGDVVIDDVPDLAAARPAGAGTWTTPTQLMQMASFLMEGDPTVLNDKARLAMGTSQVSIHGSAYDLGYGYGIFVYPGVRLLDGFHPTVAWDHGGNTLSYSSWFTVLPEYEFAISILSSGYGTDFSTAAATAIGSLIADLSPAEPPPEYEWDADRLDLHVGTYDDAYNLGEMLITREGDSLLVEIPLLEELGYVVAPELIPVGSDVWYLDLDGNYYDLTFIGEGDAPSQWVANRAFVGTRVAE